MLHLNKNKALIKMINLDKIVLIKKKVRKNKII